MPYSHLIRITLTLLLILVLIRRKVGVGPTLFICSAFLAIVYWVPFKTLGPAVLDGLIGPFTGFRTLYLLAAVLMVLILGAAMGEHGYLKKMVLGIESIFGDPRWVLGGLPAMIGLLPMPGGALFTAPMVNETAEELKLSANMRTFLNHHFRHVFEYTWPLYPGLIVLSPLVDIPIRTISIYNLPLTFAAIIGGLIFGMSRVRTTQRKKASGGGALKILDALWPILFVVALVLLFNLDLLICLFLLVLLILSRAKPWFGFIFALLVNGLALLLISQGDAVAGYSSNAAAPNIGNAIASYSGDAVAGYSKDTIGSGLGGDAVAIYIGNAVVAAVLLGFAIAKPLYPWPEFLPFLKRAIKPYMVAMVFGIMLFASIIKASGAADGVAHDIEQIGLPPIFIVCLLPAIIGYLTGITHSYVAGSFPIILPFIPEGREGLPMISLAYACGFIGVLISPVHFCLVLTVEYFKSDLMAVVRLLLPPCAVVLAVALVRYFL